MRIHFCTNTSSTSRIQRIFLILLIICPALGLLFYKSVKAQSGNISLIVYAQPATNVLLHPTGLYFAPGQSYLFFSDSGHNRIMWITGGVLATVAGSGQRGFSDGTLTTATFNTPTGLTGLGYVYYTSPEGPINYATQLNVYDAGNNAIRKICNVVILGPGHPNTLGCSFNGVKTVAGSGTAGFANGSGSAAMMYSPANGSQTTSYFADVQNNLIRSFDPNSGTVGSASSSTTPGYVNGPLSSAKFFGPTSVTADSAGNAYVTDTGNFRIRRINSSQNVTTFSGSGIQGYADGTASTAKFAAPVSAVWNSSDNSLYVADSLNNCIRRVDSSGNVTTYAGTNSPGLVNGPRASARFSNPTSVAISQGVLYVADTANNAIRSINMSTGIVNTFYR